ncbi:unnamed protein product [Chondrus crispus]|uniref:Uncharacterized protein n=1 Tax=Chondrus crispus TaxID=2769 RepID=R7QMS5_CHOCR|nr:unnamed protein product [Chondrus crispus]CDF38786.1 unnamed protein product [Chondrus crispus]|eukprot:XP_005718691.1 unnamed protein product [Chondrus crispus]
MGCLDLRKPSQSTLLNHRENSLSTVPTPSSSASLPVTSPSVTGAGGASAAKPTASGSPSPMFAIEKPVKATPDIVEEPSIENSATSSGSEDTTASPSPVVSGPNTSPSPAVVSLTPIPLLTPEPASFEEGEMQTSPEAGQERSPLSSKIPNASPVNTTTNNAAVTAVPPAGATAIPPPGSDDPPADSTTNPVASSTPKVVVTAIAPSPASSTSSAVNASPSSLPQAADVTAVPPAAPSQAGVTAIPPSPANKPDATAIPPLSESVPSSESASSGTDFTCLYFGDGTVSGFESPDTTLFSGETGKFSVPRRVFPDLAPQYLSHTYGKSWSYKVLVDSGLTYDFVLGFAEVYNVACDSGSTAGFRKFEVTIGSESTIIDIMSEAGCGKALKKSFDGVVAESNFITAAFRGFGQQAVLNTMCYRPTGGTNSGPIPQPSSVPDSSTSTPNLSDIVGPGEDFRCINFGPKVIGGYTPYDKTAVQGNTFLYRGSGPKNPELPPAYQYHLFGDDWSYSLDVSSDNPQNVVLGFAEVYPEACAAGSQGAFRVFTVSVGGDLQLVDAMKTAGCEAVEQIEFDSVIPQNGAIDLSLSSISGDSMLSVICFSDVDTSAPSQSIPTAVPPPTSSSLSPAPSGPSTPDASTYDACFKFGDEVVDGFANVELGEGVEVYTNPFAVVKGTPYDQVYGTHVFGTRFTFSVQASSPSTKKSFILGFAEVFQPACKDGFRVFDVTAGSDTETVDVYKEVGCNTAFDLRIDGVEPSSSTGRFEISFTSENNLPMLSAVCILDEGVSETNELLPSKVPDKSSATTGNSAGDGRDMKAQVNVGAPDPPSRDPSVPSTSDDESPEQSSPAMPSLEPTWTPEPLVPSPEVQTVEPSRSPQSIATDESSGPSVPPPSLPTPSSEGATSVPEESASPENSPLPKEDGVIISLPDANPESSEEDILVGPGLTSEFNGSIPSPEASVELVETDFSQTTLGVEGESQSPQASPMVTVKPSESAAIGKPAKASPSSVVEPTPSSSSEASPPPSVVGPTTTPSSSAPVSAPTSTPTGVPPEISQDAEISEAPDEDESSFGKPSNDPMESNDAPTTTAAVTAIPPNGAINGGSPGDSDGMELEDGEETSENPESSLVPEVNSGTNLNAGEEPSPLVTAVPPDGGATPSTESMPTAITPSAEEESGNAVTGTSAEESGNAVSGNSTESNQGVIIVDTSPVPSVSAVQMVPSAGPASASPPSAAPPSLVEVLPPVDNTPGPSQVPSASPSQEPTATVTPTGSASPAPTGDEDGVVGGGSESEANGEGSPSPSASQIVSTTGTDEVITVTTEEPLPAPSEPAGEISPAKPVYNSPDNSAGNIEVTDGSDVSDDNVNPDANEVIVAGEFKELISSQPEGNGFTIGMGVLGALLVLLLLICLFFAIFRSGGGAYSYSSQYSGQKPTDYGDPSQGGYTEELAPGTGDYGDTHSYGQGGQEGYAEGQSTFESRPQTNGGSFTYEGAGDPLLAGSGYGGDAPPGPVEDAAESTDAQTEPDTFTDYTSLNMQLNMQQQPTAEGGGQESRMVQNDDYTFTDTFTIQNNGIYSAETRARELAEIRRAGLAAAETSARAAENPSESFDAHASMVGPTTHPESTRTMTYEHDSATEGADDGERSMGGYGAPERAIAEQDPDIAHSGKGRHSADGGISINSNPEAVPSPYESNFVLQDEAKHSGTFQAGGERWGNILAPATGGGAGRSRVSNDGPWPAWWSRGKHLARDTPTDVVYEQEATASAGREEEETEVSDVGESKENEKSSTGVGSSMVQRHAEMFSRREGHPSVTFETPTRAAPLATSSRPNVMSAASHIAPDSGWRRGSPRKLESIDENVTVNLEFEELRRRREPYVKSVASRLSVGPQSISTSSMSRESGFDARQEYEDEQQNLKGSGLGAAPWMGQQTPIEI